jgi:hypothetical protein
VEVCQRAFQKVSAIGPTRLTELINKVTNGDLDDGFNIRARKQRKAGTFEPLTEKQIKVFNAINEVKDTLSEAMPHLSIQVKDATGDKVMQPLHFIPAGMFGSQQDIYDSTSSSLASSLRRMSRFVPFGNIGTCACLRCVKCQFRYCACFAC